MSFETPAALWALLLVPVLLWLSRRRSRPSLYVWPSLLLWRELEMPTEGQPRRRWDALLLAECAAVALLALAASQPHLEATRSRRVVFAIDRGRHMQAKLPDGRTAAVAAAAELTRVRAALAPGDEVVVVDLPEGGFARGAEDWLVIASYRDGLGGDGMTVVGRAPDPANAGIDAVVVEGDTIWYTTRTADGTTSEHRVPWRDELTLDGDDAYPGDNRIALRRFALGVSISTPHSAEVRAALFHAGIAARENPPIHLRILHGELSLPTLPRVRGADCVASDIADGLWLGDIVWRDISVSSRSDDRAILRIDGRVIASWRNDSTLWFGVSLAPNWDEHGTLALFLERAKRARLDAVVSPSDAYVGGAIASPAPGRVDLSGRDQPWDGRVPAALSRMDARVALRAVFAGMAALVLAFYVVVLRARTRDAGTV